MGSKRQIGRPRVLHLQNHGHIISSCVNDIYGHTVNLKKGGPTFFKLSQMQSILILSSFVHPCPCLAFLCFYVLSRYFDILVNSMTI